MRPPLGGTGKENDKNPRKRDTPQALATCMNLEIGLLELLIYRQATCAARNIGRKLALKRGAICRLQAAAVLAGRSRLTGDRGLRV